MGGYSSNPGSPYTNHPVIWSVNSDGSLNTQFNSVGYIDGFSISPESSSTRINKMAITTEGKLLFSGYQTIANIDMTAWRYSFFYQIDNLNPALNAEDLDGNNIEDGTQSGLIGENPVYLEDTSGNLFASVNADFDQDLDWTQVSGAVDLSSHKSFVRNLGAIEGSPSDYLLYIPQNPGDTGVWICPNATSLNDVAAGCSGAYFIAQGDPRLSTTTRGGQTYWSVSNITDGGGYSGIDNLEDTGIGIAIFVILGISLITSSAIYRKRFHK